MRPTYCSMVYLWLVMLAMVGCTGSGGAVVFAPTAPPPDTSPTQYTHPSGAFSLELPRNWAVQERNAATLATAIFSPPNSHHPILIVATVRLPEELADTTALNALLDEYQTTVRPDALRYREQTREAQGDGSWRFAGLRDVAGGRTEAVNTFIQVEGPMVGIVDAVVTENPSEELEDIVNSVRFTEALEPSSLGTLSFATSGRLEPLNVTTWTTEEGVFFVTGEVANTSNVVISDIPVTVTLFTADGRSVAEATDTVMGNGLVPGGFAPFSLRFGDGQPPLTERYTVTFGGPNWTPETGGILYGTEQLTWTDESILTPEGRLIITGSVTNITEDVFIYLPQVIVTVFDNQQRVIAAGFDELGDVELEPGEALPFEIVIPEMGGTPDEYIIGVQGQP
jgi:hypothetical protein